MGYVALFAGEVPSPRQVGRCVKVSVWRLLVEAPLRQLNAMSR